MHYSNQHPTISPGLFALLEPGFNTFFLYMQRVAILIINFKNGTHRSNNDKIVPIHYCIDVKAYHIGVTTR